jgi:hypothetical protein
MQEQAKAAAEVQVRKRLALQEAAKHTQDVRHFESQAQWAQSRAAIAAKEAALHKEAKLQRFENSACMALSQQSDDQVRDPYSSALQLIANADPESRQAIEQDIKTQTHQVLRALVPPLAPAEG